MTQREVVEFIAHPERWPIPFAGGVRGAYFVRRPVADPKRDSAAVTSDDPLLFAGHRYASPEDVAADGWEPD